MTYQMPKIFPTPETENKIIYITGVGVTKDFSVFITDLIPDIQLQANGQCFPLYWYEEKTQKQDNLFENIDKKYVRRDGVSEFIFEQAKSRYGTRVTKEDIF